MIVQQVDVFAIHGSDPCMPEFTRNQHQTVEVPVRWLKVRLKMAVFHSSLYSSSSAALLDCKLLLRVPENYTNLPAEYQNPLQLKIPPCLHGITRFFERSVDGLIKDCGQQSIVPRGAFGVPAINTSSLFALHTARTVDVLTCDDLAKTPYPSLVFVIDRH